MVGEAPLFSLQGCLDEKSEVSDAGIAVWKPQLLYITGACACAHGQHQIPDMGGLLHGSGSAHTHQLLYAIEIHQLVGIDAHGRAAHAGSHDGNGLIPVKAGVPEHVSGRIELLCSCQEVFCNVFCP